MPGRAPATLTAAETGPHWLPAVLVLLAVVIGYANALQASFQFDDWDVIVRDPRVQDVAAWWRSMPGMRPLLKLSYALNHASGLGVAGFHAVNILVHAGNGLLVLYLCRRLTGQVGYAAPAAAWLALATALIFVLHPVQTEAVTYASGRSTSLSIFFALGSLAAWVAGRSRPDRRLLYGVSPLLMILGLGTKETVAVLPVALLLWEAADVSRPFSLQAALRRSAVHWLLLFAAVGAGLSLPAYREFLATSLAIRSAGENLVAQLHGLGYLLGQLVNIDRLNADPALPVSTILDADGSLVLAVLVVVTGMALSNLRRYPLPAFAVLWCLLWLAPTNSLLARLDLVNDRQLYAPLLGPALLLAAAIQRLGVRNPVFATVALAPVLMLAGLATHLRNDVYRDEVGFWRDVVAQSPHNARAFNNLGMALAAECDLPRAEAAWRRALLLDPGYVRTAVNLRLLAEGVLPAGIGPCKGYPPDGPDLPSGG
ncbi:MAG: tetratricopeptide repeat protein [Gammaproteobacteria bacterium]